jgi:hypothetical protein
VVWCPCRKVAVTASIHIRPRSPTSFLSFLLLAQDLATLGPCGSFAIGTISSLRIALNYRPQDLDEASNPTLEGGELAITSHILLSLAFQATPRPSLDQWSPHLSTLPRKGQTTARMDTNPFIPFMIPLAASPLLNNPLPPLPRSQWMPRPIFLIPT